MSSVPLKTAGIKKRRLKLRTYPDPVLMRRCNPVSTFDKRIGDFVERMHVFMKKHSGIGLAAPQVGVLYRIVVAEVEGRPLALINPAVVSVSSDFETKREGCLSLPERAYDVKRSFHIEVRGKTPEGKGVHFEADQLLARVIQHEIDHLDGMLICDTGLAE